MLNKTKKKPVIKKPIKKKVIKKVTKKKKHLIRFFIIQSKIGATCWWDIKNEAIACVNFL